MRSPLIVLSVLVVAACSDGTSPTGLAEVQVESAAQPSRALRIAVDDVVDRLLPGLATDAIGPVSSAVRDLAAVVQKSPVDEASVRVALAHVRSVIASYRSSARPDAATLDALRLELDVQ